MSKYYEELSVNDSDKGLNDYQNRSRETWLFNHNHDELRAVLGLSGEAGEVSEKYKKKLRGDVKYSVKETFKNEMCGELGDVLYYLARLCDYNNLSMSQVANFNINKLLKRKQNGTLKGSGDNR